MKEYQHSYIDAIKNDNMCVGKGPQFLTDEATAAAYNIHHTLDSYQQTPLVCLEKMAKHLGVKAVFVKDESKRFGLNAFKGLGGLYALTRVVCKELELDVRHISFNDLQKPEWKEQVQSMVFVTATDGNHGKGVAWAAAQLGCEAHVYMPVGSSELRAQAIKDFGKTEVRIMETGYDDTVRFAALMAKEHGWHLVQDTSWDGYEEIPAWIIQGYTTMAKEAVLQMSEAGYDYPTHVFLQAGVGAMAGGGLGYLVNHYEDNRPTFGIVEPEYIACIYQSAKMNDGKPHPAIETGSTIMAGLNCGEPCTITWPILRDFADWYYKCPDFIAALGMRLLGVPEGDDESIVSGESGAVTTGLLYALLEKDEFVQLKELAGLDKNSVVLLFNTEGDTDPDNYRKIVYEGKEAMPN